MPLRVEAGLVVVDVELRSADGWRQTPLVLDLGAGLALTATDDVLQWAGGTDSAGRSVRNARGDRIRIDGRVLAGVRLGNREWSSVQAYGVAWHPDYAPPVRVGVVGRPLFDGLPFVVDLAHREMVFDVAVSAADCIPLTADSRGIVIEVEIDGEPVEAILDTAATATIVTDRRLVGDGGATVDGRPVTLGPREFVDLPGLPTDLLIGVPFFLAHRVAIDQPAGCLALD